MDYEINDNDENQIKNEKNINRDPVQYFKVTPDDYTESDSNTIIDFDEEEDSKTQNQIEEQNQNQNPEQTKFHKIMKNIYPMKHKKTKKMKIKIFMKKIINKKNKKIKMKSKEAKKKMPRVVKNNQIMGQNKMGSQRIRMIMMKKKME